MRNFVLSLLSSSVVAASLTAGTPAQAWSGPNPAAGTKAAVTDASASKASSQEVTSPVKDAEAPLYFKIGGAKFTPGGYIDFNSIFRTTDVGSGTGTSFASIPYNNTLAGGNTETRFTPQSSRVSLRVDENVSKAKVYGYLETDFNGYQPQNANVSTNADTLRLRVFFADVSLGKWEFVGGQDWSLLTPNRVGLSALPTDIYSTLYVDTNYTAGLTYARQPLVRALYHFTPSLHLGLSVENPQQFTGNAVTFPSLFSNAELDVNSNPTSSSAGGNTTVPNLHPDIILKLAADKKVFGHNYHFEAAGLLTPVAIDTLGSNAAIGGSSTSNVTGLPYTVKKEYEGGGASFNSNLELFKGFHLIQSAFWSDGGGRYIGGLGPAFVVAQRGVRTAPFTALLVHSGSGVAGFEWQLGKTTVSSSYSGAYFQRRYSADPANSNALVGYGYKTPSTAAGLITAQSQNRAIQEGTFSTQTTLWKKPSYGALLLTTQTSYVTRSPWYVPVGAPKNAHNVLEYIDVRFVLP